ncbi:MAG: hypothetical protein NTY20_00045 [Candidatus Aenigmarchaeota archaeon]|nr:hypothetical protein [Candidatus Aenigmarchaeota archaeon]
MVSNGTRRFSIEKSSRELLERKVSEINSIDPNLYDIFFYAGGKIRKGYLNKNGYFPGDLLEKDRPEYRRIKKLIDP